MANTTHLSIQGIHCGGCVSKITKALTPLADKVEVTLNPPTATLTNVSASLTQINKVLAKAGDYKAAQAAASQAIKPPESPKSWLATYQPLLIIVAYILGVSLLIETQQASFEFERWMMHFMAGFFLVFSFFKMLNIRAFANSYAMYDLLAMRWQHYGLLYPFIELGLGVAYLVGYNQHTTNLLTFIVMSFSSLGVIQAVMNKHKIRCACLGTVFNLPMSTVTIIEDLLMAGMAAWMLI
jgi:copper chaperone CopZ